MNFNVNFKVRVKLTDFGRFVHRRNHDTLFAGIKMPPKYRAPEETDGWSEWQLWDLMREFGSDMRNGYRVPFETEIEIPEGQS